MIRWIGWMMLTALLGAGQFTSPQRAMSPLSSGSTARTYVTGCALQTSSTSSACAATVSAGNTVVVFGSNANTNTLTLTHSASSGTVSGSTCTTWASGARNICYWTVAGYAESGSDTFTLSASTGTALTVVAMVASGGSLDASATQFSSSSSTTALTGATVTTTAANELVFFYAQQGGASSGTVTCSSSPIALTAVENPTLSIEGCYGSVATAGSTNAAATSTAAVLNVTATAGVK